jgi:hypothetical protein
VHRRATSTAPEPEAGVALASADSEEEQAIALPETGTASLRLLLVNAITGDGEESRVRLWRMGTGTPLQDHVQAEFHLRGSHQLSDLPTGRFRLEVWDAAEGHDDPPEFEVRSDRENTFTARATMPEEVPMRLYVFDERGEALVRGHRRMGSSGSSWGPPSEPPSWAHPRPAVPRPSGGFGGRRGGRVNLSTSRSKLPIEAHDGAFDLGVIRRAGRQSSRSQSYTFTFTDRTEVRVRVLSRDADSGAYVAIAAPRQSLVDAVRLPDGTRAADAGAEIETVCSAVAATHGIDGLWREVTVHVTSRLAGYDNLEFDWRVDDGAPLPHTLNSTRAEAE